MIRPSVFALLLVSSAFATAGSVTLTWDPIADARVGGYQILYGTVSGGFSNTLDVPGGRAASTYTVQNLDGWTKYYFVARAHNTDKTLFSLNSNEVDATIPLTGPGALSVTVTVSVNVGQ